LGWLRKAGLVGAEFRLLPGSVCAPLSAVEREALASLLAMRWRPEPGELDSADLEAYRRLCDPESEHCILDRPDYVAGFAYSLFSAALPG
jgi:hypothetical protein